MDETVSQSTLANGQTTSGLYINEGDGDDDHPGGRGDVVDGPNLPSVSDFKSLPKSPLNWLGRVVSQMKNKLHSTIIGFRSRTAGYTEAPRQPPSEENTGALNHDTWYNATTDVVYGILVSSWVNLLLVFVPIGLACYFVEAGSLTTFILNGIAIIPLSAILTDATERIAAHSGDTLGALLNISLGNLVELILLVALAENHVRVVQASLLGSILVNLLLILGSALLAASAGGSIPLYNTTEAQLLACLLFVSVFTFIMPSAFDRAFDHAEETASIVLKMTRISSLLVLGIYMIYLIHEVRSNKGPFKDDYYRATFNGERSQQDELQSELGRTGIITPLVLPPRTIRFADENAALPTDNHITGDTNRFELGSLKSDVDSEEDEDPDARRPRGLRRSFETDTTRSVPNSHLPLMHASRHGRSISWASSGRRISRDSSMSRDLRIFARSGLTSLQLLRDNRHTNDYELNRSPAPVGSIVEIVISVIMLALSSMLMSMNAELLVTSIDDVTQQSGLSHTFIGLIILPIVGNISEYVTVVTVAIANKLDLAIAVAVGSSIQIALCLAPLIVMAGWILQVEFSLTFNIFEMTVLVGTVLLVNLLILNSNSSTLKTSGLKGALMCACYGIIGLAAFFAPESV